MFWEIWYLLGILGVCIITYIDSKNDTGNNHLAQELYIALAGPIAFIYSLWCIYSELAKK